MTISEVGSDVVASYSGSINTAALSLGGQSNLIGGLGPFVGVISWGGTALSPLPYDAWSGLTAVPFGSGTGILQALTSGDAFGILGQNLALPSGYVSGATISASTTYTGNSFISLGLTPGTYTWSWGVGPTADSIVMTIGSTPSPGPAAAPGPLPLFGAAAAYTWSRRLRRRCGRG